MHYNSVCFRHCIMSYRQNLVFFSFPSANFDKSHTDRHDFMLQIYSLRKALKAQHIPIIATLRHQRGLWTCSLAMAPVHRFSFRCLEVWKGPIKRVNPGSHLNKHTRKWSVKLSVLHQIDAEWMCTISPVRSTSHGGVRPQRMIGDNHKTVRYNKDNLLRTCMSKYLLLTICHARLAHCVLFSRRKWNVYRAMLERELGHILWLVITWV